MAHGTCSRMKSIFLLLGSITAASSAVDGTCRVDYINMEKGDETRREERSGEKSRAEQSRSHLLHSTLMSAVDQPWQRAPPSRARPCATRAWRASSHVRLCCRCDVSCASPCRCCCFARVGSAARPCPAPRAASAAASSTGRRAFACALAWSRTQRRTPCRPSFGRCG